MSLKNDYKFDLYTVFLYLCKKKKFQKFNNSKNLWKKWYFIYYYIDLLYQLNLLKNVVSKNLSNFFYYLKACIFQSNLNGKTFGNVKHYFNFRKHIFRCIHVGIYSTFFKKGFFWMTYFLKIFVFIINNDNNLNSLFNMTFTYSFISNNNVTAPFLARYIVLKVKRGFTIVKTLNPLRRELSRVAALSRRNQKPYSIRTLYKSQIKTIKLYKSLYRHYLYSCTTYFYILLHKYYNNNNILIIPNIYLFYKKKVKKFNFNLFRLKKVFKTILNVII
jgi:hypothetical protein